MLLLIYELAYCGDNGGRKLLVRGCGGDGDKCLGAGWDGDKKLSPCHSLMETTPAAGDGQSKSVVSLSLRN